MGYEYEFKWRTRDCHLHASVTLKENVDVIYTNDVFNAIER